MPLLTIMDFGAAGDGVTPDDLAFQQAFATSDHVIVPKNTYRIANTATWPKGKTLEFLAGAQLVLDIGVVLTIRGSVTAGLTHIFAGNGRVTGIRSVRPRWWGADLSGATSSLDALQAAANCVADSAASDGGEFLIDLSGGDYAIHKTWHIYVSANVGLRVRGSGTVFNASRINALGTSSRAPAVSIEGSSDDIQKIVDFQLTNLSITADNPGSWECGLQFNSLSQRSIIGLQQSLVENVHVSGFRTGIKILKTRLVKFSRVSVWGNGVTDKPQCSVYIGDVEPGSFETGFCGDLTFDNCQFVSDKTNERTAGMLINSIGTTVIDPPTGVAGIRVTECIFYKSHMQLWVRANQNSTMGDFWVDRCQFDDNPGHAIYVEQVGPDSQGGIYDLHITNNYFTAVAIKTVALRAETRGSVNSVIVSNNWLAGCGYCALEAMGCANVTVANNQWTGCTWRDGNVMNFVDSVHLSVTNNSCGRGGTSHVGQVLHMTSFVGICDWVVYHGNNSCGISTGSIVDDQMTGNHKWMWPNI